MTGAKTPALIPMFQVVYCARPPNTFGVDMGMLDMLDIDLDLDVAVESCPKDLAAGKDNKPSAIRE